MTSMHVVISCEHAVNTVPATLASLFQHEPSILNTHQGFDKGAIDVAKHLSRTLDCPIVLATVSRLIIDCNRSLTHPACFSSFTKTLSPDQKKRLITQYYLPYRQEVERLIDDMVQQGNQVLHLSVHSFTPALNHVTRNNDIGFLYDPARVGEKQLASRWARKIVKEHHPYRIRMNYPYRGTSDGFTSGLRRKYPEQYYLGIELENNQLLMQDKGELNQLSEVLASSLIDL